MAYTRKKYKNTTHKNPFREDRPKSKKPLIISLIAAAALIAVIVGIVFLVNYCSVVRLVKEDSGALYDPKSGIRYYPVDSCYTARLDTSEVYAECDGVEYFPVIYGITPTKDGYVSTKKVIASINEYSQVVYIYAAEGFELPGYESITPENTLIMEVELVEYAVGAIKPEDMAPVMEYFRDDANVLDQASVLNFGDPDFINSDSQRWLYISDSSCPGIYYIIRYIEDNDGGRYLYTFDRSRYVSLGDKFKDINFEGATGDSSGNGAS